MALRALFCCVQCPQLVQESAPDYRFIFPTLIRRFLGVSRRIRDHYERLDQRVARCQDSEWPCVLRRSNVLHFGSRWGIDDRTIRLGLFGIWLVDLKASGIILASSWLTNLTAGRTKRVRRAPYSLIISLRTFLPWAVCEL